MEPFASKLSISRNKRIEFAFSRSHRSSEFHTLRPLEAQSLLGTLRNQVAFDFLDETLLRTLTTIRAITDDNQLNDAEKVDGIRTQLNTHETSLSDDGRALGM
jgi:hypothetical protein